MLYERQKFDTLRTANFNLSDLIGFFNGQINPCPSVPQGLEFALVDPFSGFRKYPAYEVVGTKPKAASLAGTHYRYILHWFRSSRDP